MHSSAPFRAAVFFPVDIKVLSLQTIASTAGNTLRPKMKVLTLNFLTCAVKTCKTSADSFPLHPRDAELASDDVELNPQLLVNLLPRIDWNALRTTSTEASMIYIHNTHMLQARPEQTKLGDRI